MKINKIYKENKEAVKDLLTSLWISDPRNDRQIKYADQIKNLIDKELFASEDYMPLVQCMDPYESASEVDVELFFRNGNFKKLWEKSTNEENYNPYKHQLEAWKVLSDPESTRSMVITTGTGSGKTEAFMIPLINDLLQHRVPNKIQAIFLYPLNALMEDQKERLQTLLRGTDLKFAVYNGNMPKSEEEADEAEAASSTPVDDPFPNMIKTRREMHQTPPNILLTNPTMLEYMLLRQEDQQLFSENSLRWVVIDETHTFSGAGAAELAMLLRRVLEAFGKKPNEVHFATSSATVGSGQNEEENKIQLISFISDLTGVSLDQIDLITGQRVKTEDVNNKILSYRNKLREKEFVKLDELITDGSSIEDKLKILDKLCEAGLKAKAHIFYRVPNNGLRVNLTDHSEGVFKVNASTPLGQEGKEDSYLELMRCEHCGEYFAVGEAIKDTSDGFQALTQDTDDIFTSEDDRKNNLLIFGLTKQDVDNEEKAGNKIIGIDGNRIIESPTYSDGEWRIIRNAQCNCPLCTQSLTKKKSRNNNEDDPNNNENNPNNNEDDPGQEDISKYARNFRIPTSLISQTLAKGILEEMKLYEGDSSDEDNRPLGGRQFISFVDSRHAAAESTLKQNLQQEKRWVYSRIFNKLNKLVKNASKEQETLRIELTLKQNYLVACKEANYQDEIRKTESEIQNLQRRLSDPYLTWHDIYKVLANEKEADWFAYEFAIKGRGESELEIGENVSPEFKMRYILSIMIDLLSKRPKVAYAPETAGLISSYYPALDTITQLPEAVEKFNEHIVNEDDKIGLDDWKNLLKIFLDHNVRSNQSFFIQDDENYRELDIFKCQRFQTEKDARRPVKKPCVPIDDRKVHPSIITGLLADLLAPNSESLRKVIIDNRPLINDVLNALWTNLTIDTRLLEIDVSFNKNPKFKDIPPYAFNLKNLAFRLPKEAWLVDSRVRGASYPTYRPVDKLFKKRAPYLVNQKVKKIEEEPEQWEPFEYTDGKNGDNKVTRKEILDWAEENRLLLWNNNIWGEYGLWSSRLTDIYSFPDIFIQAEHTAQVNKKLSRESQEKFKQQRLNILACSTTMEMGVDIGNLELVMMASVPPHPSNYKQRAGRSGRREQNLSASITLCGSDAIGIGVLRDPLKSLINRPVQIPTVDLQSKQVIRRHINAFLFRKSGIFFNREFNNQNNLGQEVISFFTTYVFADRRDGGSKAYYYIEDSSDNNKRVYPNQGLGEITNTPYGRFLNYLNGGENSSLKTDSESLESIIAGTCYDRNIVECVENCKNDIKSIYQYIKDKVESLKKAYIEEYNRLIEKGRNNDISGQISESCEISSWEGKRLRMAFASLLAENLITFFATNRFTPNANMPVNIVDFNLEVSKNREFDFSRKSNNNPSYSLREALSQFVPGNSVVLENKTRTIKGIEYTGKYRDQAKIFKTYYHDDSSVSEFKEELAHEPETWPIHGKESLTVVSPISYIPDVNAGYSRVVDNKIYTGVNAILLGADKWESDTSAMIATRNNHYCPNGKILYYNHGIGYGYCLCAKCGKTVLETERPQGGDRMAALRIMNDQSRDNSVFHYHIRRKDSNNRSAICNSTPKNFRRNVILGDTIQTDYCEIMIKDCNKVWIYNREEQNLLSTIGVLLTKVFAEYLNKDRKDIDFMVMLNGHICIFDTNPGGSGYSNQLANQKVLRDVIVRAKELLDGIRSKEELIDKSTIRYLNKIDISGTRNWLDMVVKSLETVPQSIKDLYPEAQPAVLEDLYRDFSQSPAMLFVDSDWDNWIYEGDVEGDKREIYGLKNRVAEIHRNKNIDLVILGDSINPGPAQKAILGKITDWATLKIGRNPLENGLFPVALMNDVLYFTPSNSAIHANYGWGSHDLYRVKLSEMPEWNFKTYQLKYDEGNAKKIILKDDKSKKIKSTDLALYIHQKYDEKCRDLIDRFINHCKENEDKKIKVIYQDEHFKSPAAMITALQFIQYIVELFPNKFSLEFIMEEYGNESSGSRYPYFTNLPDYSNRDDVLSRVVEDWKTNIVKNCENFSMSSQPKRSLPHWRCFKFICGNMTLGIYPNGGIINEWFQDNYSDIKVPEYTEDFTADLVLPIYRRNPIMYDVEIENS